MGHVLRSSVASVVAVGGTIRQGGSKYVVGGKRVTSMLTSILCCTREQCTVSLDGRGLTAICNGLRVLGFNAGVLVFPCKLCFSARRPSGNILPLTFGTATDGGLIYAVYARSEALRAELCYNTDGPTNTTMNACIIHSGNSLEVISRRNTLILLYTTTG